MLVPLLWKLFLFLDRGVWAVRNPHELDYGEGIVWQQMRMIMGGRGYGPIDGFPSIVFHYPPVYHALSFLVATAGHMDQLSAGRLVSLSASLCAAALVGLIAAHLAKDGPRSTQWICGLTAALIPLTCEPIAYWAPLMRVDMVACALSLMGLYLALLSVERPWLIYTAAAAFVAAVFTKQTMIAAPTAVFLVLLVLRPRQAAAGIAACVALGLLVLGPLALETHGRFLQHIFAYNVNRFEPDRLKAVPLVALHNSLYLLAADAGLWISFRSLRPPLALGRGWNDVSRRLAQEPSAIRLLIVVLYLGFATGMLVLSGKMGSSINYYIEWLLALAIPAGLGVQAVASALCAGRAAPTRRTPALLMVIPFAIAAQAAALAAPTKQDNAGDAKNAAELALLSQQIRSATKPIISDNMVILIQAGKEVVWEPAIFAELATTGVYDQRPMVQMIRNGDFAFFITYGRRGDGLFDERYNPPVAQAMEERYPRTRVLAGLTVHYPAETRP